jgi:hypothetical protein
MGAPGARSSCGNKAIRLHTHPERLLPLATLVLPRFRASAGRTRVLRTNHKRRFLLARDHIARFLRLPIHTHPLFKTYLLWALTNVANWDKQLR